MAKTAKQRAKEIEMICSGVEILNKKRMKLNLNIDKEIKNLIEQKFKNDSEFLEAKDKYIEKECKKYNIRTATINRILN